MSSPAAIREIDGAEASLPRSAPADTPNFDRLARVYRWMEWLSFGPYLWRCRRAFLPEMGAALHALVLGDGDGRFTAALMRGNRQVKVDAVDLSAAMLGSLRTRAAEGSGRLHTEVADLREWGPADIARYDLVVTHFFLDCLTTREVAALIERLRPGLTRDVRWVVSEFAVPRGMFGRFVAQPVVAFLYRAFGVLTGLRVRRLPDYSSALAMHGFHVEQERRMLHGLLVAQVWRMGGVPEGE